MKSQITLFLKGVAMGAADVVPGVSGGTIAFITGIYETLINSIKSVNATALKLLFSFQLKAFWEYINGTFLLILFAGIATSVLSLAKLITYLLEHHPIPIWSCFFGLIIISAILVGKQIRKWSVPVLLTGIAGIAIAYFVTVATPTSTPENYGFIFLSGAIAICAMILPGISGSFLLLILGKYAFILNAIKNLQLDVIAVFGAGCVLGLALFSRFISWLLSKYHDLAVALLSGFMIGSLNKVWPWKEVLSTRINSHGEEVALITKNILPSTYGQHANPQTLVAIICIVGAIALVFGLDYFASRSNTKQA
ncbi:DUF368 domain-containing protein [Persicobacter psychrovividus]|uniref:DUF368 domain-containing protein n=1 Tax=Persicobacter psychrovividus TaxID=387638 RepID=A0ABM7VGN1_9BACT|nr:DUF368 domain-containing protein [Persicobacter psychrovividus]